MINFVEITEDKRINEFINLANDIWHEYFPFILSENQINYMLNKFQSFDVTKKQLDEGYKYYFVALNEYNIGYFVYKKETDCLFLSKLYLKKEYRGNRFGRKMLLFLEKVAIDYNINKIKLTVNKNNISSIMAYKAWGFEITDSVVFDIGQGYVMDDYIMQKNLSYML